MITLMEVPLLVLFNPLLHCVVIVSDPHLHQTVIPSHMLGSLLLATHLLHPTVIGSSPTLQPTCLFPLLLDQLCGLSLLLEV